MTTRTVSTFGRKRALSAALLVLLAITALPGRAQDVYAPIEGDIARWNAGASNCAMEISDRYEETCGLYAFPGLSDAPDRPVCESECAKCCDGHDQLWAGDLFLYDTLCRCVQGFTLTGGFGILGCAVPATINAAFSAGWLSEEQRFYALAVQNLIVLGRLNINVLLAARNFGGSASARHAQVVALLEATLPALQREFSLEFFATGILGILQTTAMAVDACGWVDEQAREWNTAECHRSCSRWYRRAAPPQPTDPTEEPEVSGGGGGHPLEPNNNVVPDPPEDGGGGGGLPPGTVSWIESFGDVVEGGGGPPP